MERTYRSPRWMPHRNTPWPVRPVARLASSLPTLALTPTSVLGPPPPTPPSTTPSATSAFHPYYILSSSNSSPPAAVARLPPSPSFLGCRSGGCFWAPQLHAHAHSLPRHALHRLSIMSYPCYHGLASDG